MHERIFSDSCIANWNVTLLSNICDDTGFEQNQCKKANEKKGRFEILKGNGHSELNTNFAMNVINEHARKKNNIYKRQ